jgi:hypothetical protein
MTAFEQHTRAPSATVRGEVDMIDRAWMMWISCVSTAACAFDPATDDDGANQEADEGASAGDSGAASTEGGDESTDAESGGDAASVCDAQPCGGDVVGTWSYHLLLCGETTPHPPMECNDFGSYMDIDVEGTLEFTADGSSILHRRTNTKERWITSKECVPNGNCAEGFPDIECVDDGMLCDCSVTTHGEWIDEVTPYSVVGDSLSFEAPDGTESIAYCVGGDALALIHPEIGEWTYLERME